MSPAAGPMVGGTSVRITGINFKNETGGVTGVMIGGRQLGRLRVVSKTEITGTTPASSNVPPLPKGEGDRG